MTFSVVNGAFRYPRAPREILDDINFSVEQGELLAILGPNGAGKTTLMRAMIGLLPWTRGQSLIDGVALGEMTQAQVGRHIAYVPQARSAVTLSLSGLDMVTLGRAPHLGLFAQPGRRERAMALEMLHSLGVDYLAEMPCGNMSGGQFQMVLIARALVAGPRVLVLDEPETGLDFRNQLVVLSLLRQLVTERDLAVVINTHYPAHALRIADQVILVNPGDRPISGPAAEVMTEQRLSAVFDVDVRIGAVEHRDRPIPAVVAAEARRHNDPLGDHVPDPPAPTPKAPQIQHH